MKKLVKESLVDEDKYVIALSPGHAFDMINKQAETLLRILPHAGMEKYPEEEFYNLLTNIAINSKKYKRK